MLGHANRIKKSQVSHRSKLAAARQAAAAQGYRNSGLNSRFERSQLEANDIQANADKVQKANNMQFCGARDIALYAAVGMLSRWLSS